MEQGITFITHANCNDGLMSAVVFKIFIASGVYPDIKDNYEIIFKNYNDPIDVSYKYSSVYFVDFSTSVDNYLKILENGHSINVIDHHVSARKTLIEHSDKLGSLVVLNDTILEIAATESSNFTATVNTTGCGASLYFNVTKSTILNDNQCEFGTKQFRIRFYDVMERVEDRDLWKYEFTDTDIIANMLKGKDPDQVIELLKNSEMYDKEYISSEAIVNYQETVNKSAASKAFEIQFQGYTVPVVNTGNGISISKVGEELYTTRDIPFCIMFFITKDTMVCSLRSAKNGVLVNEIAEKFGGGGHPNAAGFSLPFSSIPDFLLGNL